MKSIRKNVKNLRESRCVISVSESQNEIASSSGGASVTSNLTSTFSTPSNADQVVIKSPVPSPASIGANFVNGRPPGAFQLPGIHSVAAAARSKASSHSEGSSSGTASNSEAMIGATTSNSGSNTTQVRSIYSPDGSSVVVNSLHSPLNGGIIDMAGFPAPVGNRPQASPKNERPSNLGSVIGVNPSINNNNNSTNTKGKKTRWLLCYPSGGAASSESPSPPNEEAPVGSSTSTPSPTDGGFKIPNSQSNERPTSLPVALLNSSQRNGSKSYVNPLSIDPNERVTPSGPGMGLPDHNGLMDPNNDHDIPDLSIAVTEIGVIPPPPMFSSPSPPPPPPPPLTSNQVSNGHVIVNHQVFHTNITVDGHDLSGAPQGQDSPRYMMHDEDLEDEDQDPDEGLDEEDEDELEDEFDNEYGNPAFHPSGLNTRIITTVPAKEPSYSAQPLKSALKKPKGMNGISARESSSSKSSNDSSISSSSR